MCKVIRLQLIFDHYQQHINKLNGLKEIEITTLTHCECQIKHYDLKLKFDIKAMHHHIEILYSEIIHLEVDIMEVLRLNFNLLEEDFLQQMVVIEESFHHEIM